MAAGSHDPGAFVRHACESAMCSITSMQHATGAIHLVASPVRLSKTPPEYRLAPPTLGEHTSEILRDTLELCESEIADLREKGVI